MSVRCIVCDALLAWMISVDEIRNLRVLKLSVLPRPGAGRGERDEMPRLHALPAKGTISAQTTCMMGSAHDVGRIGADAK